MVREIVHVQVGQCGNQIGNAFWSTMCGEHNIGNDGKFITTDDKVDDAKRKAKVDVYFKTAGNRFVPRSVLVDLEPGTLDMIKKSAIGKLFQPDNFAFGASGAGNNWAKGHYTEGAELIDDVIDIIRKETEDCDCPQGFQICHSLGGGTGSGMGTLLLLKIRDNYPDRITCTYSVYPSPKVSDVVVEPYNATLSIHQLLENSDETFVIDNEALYNIAHNILKLNQPKYTHLNWIISLVMSGITSSLRFSGKLNGDLRKMGVNLVPFPRLHFFLIAQAPIFSEETKNKVNLNVAELTSQMWGSKNFLANVDPSKGKYLSASCTYRGNIATQEVDDEVSKIQQKMSDDFVTWIPNNIKSSIIETPPTGIKMSGTFVANTTALQEVFQRISAQFAKMYKRKAFLHWYKGEGMDEMEFQEADKNMRDLVTEYQDKANAVVELDKEEAGDEDAAGDEEAEADGE
jgi:tubulin beta